MQVSKVIYTAVCLMWFAGLFTSLAQQRYFDPIFSAPNKTANVHYGQNLNLIFQTVNLHLDIYEPPGDTATKRPLFIFCHGGGFTMGSKDEPFIVALCDSMARRGYVTASINYTLIPQSLIGVIAEDTLAFLALLKATQDANAAIRYFNQNHSQYAIDTNLIFIGGFSAGGATALGKAYMDQWELPVAVDTTILGSLEGGNNGSPGYSSKIAGCWNGWGAISDTNYIQFGDVALLNTHGTADQTVLCNSTSTTSGLAAYGACAINDRAVNIGLTTRFKLFQGGGHGVNIHTPQMDTLTSELVSFFYKLVKPCSEPFNTSTLNVGPSGATLSWQIEAWQENPSIRIRGRKEGNSNWASLDLLNYMESSFEVVNLESQTKYYWQIARSCEEGGISEFSDVDSFTTGCFEPTNFGLDSTQNGQYFLEWEGVVGVEWYRVRAVLHGDRTVFLAPVHQDSARFILDNLVEGKAYTFQIRSICSSNGTIKSSLTDSIVFNVPSSSRFASNELEVNKSNLISTTVYSLDGKILMIESESDVGNNSLGRQLPSGIFIVTKTYDNGSYSFEKLAKFTD